VLRVYLAGRVEVELNGKAVFDERDMRGKQSRAAFAYLALQRDRPVVKDELAEALWPGEMPPAWESALSALLSRLRSLLPEGSTISGGAGLHQLHLPADTWVDLDAAALALDQAEGELRAGLPRSAFGPGVVAYSICKRPFLPGHNAPWSEAIRERQQRHLLRALECLSRVWLATGEPNLAVESASEAIALDPFRESSYCLLMQAHDLSGNRPEALRTYQRLRTVLSEELGAGPAPETQALHQKLLG